MKKQVLSCVAFFAFALSAYIAPDLMMGTPQAKASEEAASEEGKPQYVELKPLILPVLGEKRAEQVVVLVVALEAVDQHAVDAIKAKGPRLTDAYFSALYGTIDNRMVSRGKLLDVARLKTTLENITHTVVGPELVRGVLIQGISQRNL